MIKGLIFDFDGLILDTETTDLQSWQEIYSDYGVTFPVSQWMDALGGSHDLFDPYSYLVSQLGQDVDLVEVRAKKSHLDTELIQEQLPRPGVKDYIEDANKLDLRLGLASSSERDWVLPHLFRLGLASRFQSIKCSDDVVHTKPAPDLFHAVLQELNLQSNQAIAFEDSSNGVLAANRAGIYCVAVPNAVTSQLSLDHADLRVESLAELPLEDLIQRVQQHLKRETEN
ncbi:MAG: HAD-IA family hydrolase [Anaerolineales bacterium]|nr:HAD-IA family hydrolase [Anaerolineales bacterium]